MSRPVSANLHDFSGPPSWWQRKYGVVSGTYQDATLIQNYSTPFQPANLGAPTYSGMDVPSSYHHQQFGLMKWDQRELDILPFENRQKLSQANWALFIKK